MLFNRFIIALTIILVSVLAQADEISFLNTRDRFWQFASVNIEAQISRETSIIYSANCDEQSFENGAYNNYHQVGEEDATILYDDIFCPEGPTFNVLALKPINEPPYNRVILLMGNGAGKIGSIFHEVEESERFVISDQGVTTLTCSFTPTAWYSFSYATASCTNEDSSIEVNIIIH